MLKRLRQKSALAYSSVARMGFSLVERPPFGNTVGCQRIAIESFELPPNFGSAFSQVIIEPVAGCVTNTCVVHPVYGVHDATRRRCSASVQNVEMRFATVIGLRGVAVAVTAVTGGRAFRQRKMHPSRCRLWYTCRNP